MAGHARKKIYEWSDAGRSFPRLDAPLELQGAFPRLPNRASAPPELREALRCDAQDILSGRWRAFGHLELKVDEPPRWQSDYLVGKDLATAESAFKLNHRELPGGADIRIIWELSRWHPLVRLAQAAYVLDDARAAETCLRWLEDWVATNPPYRGWNWTSALEAGLRLIQFVWIDALLSTRPGAGDDIAKLERLRESLLPAHVWFIWRHKSFGSSANNHLLGELAGLILATARWPGLAKFCAPLSVLQRVWEKQVLAQFAEDGGNREQALNYHLFAWELSWQTRKALLASGQTVHQAVEERLTAAARFYWEVQARREPWDYGDSDNSIVTPFYVRETSALIEWRDWLRGAGGDSGWRYWLGDGPPMVPRLGLGDPAHTREVHGWWLYLTSGIGTCESGYWWLRWDGSPLGYLSTAAHGHLDAQHLSIWFKGVALVIDPGTGAYYADPRLRAWLASRAAHNGPRPAGEEFPKRRGPFLWAQHHRPPLWKAERRSETQALTFTLLDSRGKLRRTVRRIEQGDGWLVEDAYDPKPESSKEFSVRWQFAPGAWVKRLGERSFSIQRDGASLRIEVGPDWAGVEMVENQPEQPQGGALASLEGVVSPAFRKTLWAPYLKLTGRIGNKPCVFQTTFLASNPS